MNNKFKVYLAGKMSGLSYEEMNSWRSDAEMLFSRYYDVKTLNPVRFYNFELDKANYTEKEVMDFDLHLVKNSNLVLVNLNRPDTIGTAIELFYCKENKIPIVAFGRNKNMLPHPWIECCINKEVETLNQAIEYINGFYLSSY